jgi:hypothetical protein
MRDEPEAGSIFMSMMSSDKQLFIKLITDSFDD